VRSVPQGLNLSLWLDLQRRLGTHDLVEWLETETQRIADLGRTPGGAVDFTPALLRDRKVVSKQAKPYLPALQTISATPRGYEIRYNQFQRLEDQRFGIAHEIAHTLWLIPDGSGRPISPLQRAIGDDPTIEWLCNRGAAAILLPRSDLTSIVAGIPMVLHLISSTVKRYVVPERLVARRVFHELGQENVFVLAARLVGEKAKVAWFTAPPRVPDFIKRVEDRIIPKEILPDVPNGKTTETEIDGRWWLLTSGASSPRRAKPLDQSEPMEAKRAWACRDGDAWHIALTSE
jgi:hypothetical protein